MPTKERIAEWREWQLARGLSVRTVDERDRLMRLLQEETGCDPLLMTTAEIVDWMGSHSAGGRRREWSAGTRRSYFNVLRAWFHWLALQEYRLDDPTVKIGSPRVPSYEPHPVADEHLPRLLATPMKRKTKAMILMAALCGLRVHEIGKLKGEDFDLIARTLTVKGKGGKKRVMPIPDAIVSLAESMPRRGWWFPTRAPEGHVQAKSVSAIIGEVMRRAGIRGSAHSLRHWFGTTLVAGGTDLRTVQELLRHSSLATTQVYTQVSDEARREAVDRLDLYRSERKIA